MTFTNIEWADRVWNPTTGCVKISQGCKFCYAEREWRIRHQFNPRHIAYGRKFTDVQSHPERLAVPFSWRKPARVFVDSISDLFQEGIAFEFIAAVFGSMALNPRHTFLILTKRPDIMRTFFEWIGHEGTRRNGPVAICVTKLLTESDNLLPSVQALIDWQAIYKMPWPLANVWLGSSMEDQAAVDARLPELLATPAAVHWISAGPLLGHITLPSPAAIGPKIGWIVAEGESGSQARPAHPDWFRTLRDQALQHAIPFNIKQLGEYIVPEDGAQACRVCGCTWNNACEGSCYWHEPDLCSTCIGKTRIGTDRAVKFQRVGRRHAGRELDGVTWDQYPTTPAV